MKRKVLSIILACTMLFGVAASTFAVSAAEVDTSLPPSVSKEDMTAAASKIDNLLFSLIDMSSFINNNTIQMLLQDVLTLAPNTVWPFTLDIVPHPLDGDPNAGNWNNFYGGLPENMDWGVEAGNFDSFFSTLKKVLRALLGDFGVMLLCDKNPDSPPTEPGDMFGLPTPLYRFALYPILQDMGMNVPDPAEYSREVRAAYNALMSSPVLGNIDQIGAKQAQISNAIQQGDTDTANRLIAECRELGAPLAAEFDKLVNPMLEPIMGLLNELTDAPVTTLLKYAPGLDKAAKAGHLDWLWGLVAPNMTEKPNSLVGVLNTVLGMVNINGTTLDITLPDYDFTAWNDLDNTDRLTAFMNYAVEVIRAEGNAAAITALVPENLQGVVNTVLGLDDNSIKHFLVNFIAYNKMEFTPPETTTDPKGEEPTTKPSAGDPTEPTETTTGGGTTGGENSQPDTGDTAMAAVAFTGLLAAGACVLLFKKKSSL